MELALREELDQFIGSAEANFGMATPRGQQLIAKFPSEDDDAYKYFVDIMLHNTTPPGGESEDTVVFINNAEDHAAKSYRAMTILKQDLARTGAPSMLIKGPAQAGLLAKDLLMGLSKVKVESESQRYSTFHIRELLDALLEAFPEKTMAAAAAGGKQGVHAHLNPLLHFDQTLSVLTHLVCIGATGRKGIASSEKSAQHTAMYHHMQNDPRNKISLGQRRKFVKAMSDFQLMDQLAIGLKSKSAGEELCETILTVLEVIGYPPEVTLAPGQQPVANDKDKDEMVGEDVLLAPLGKAEWWKGLLETIERDDCTYEQREAISRTCNQAFALATGNSSRICRSHAPATDATEQTSEKLVEEEEEKVKNRLVEWGLTDEIHAALRTQLPLLIRVLKLPSKDILNYEATQSTATNTNSPASTDTETLNILIRHPGRYQTQPMGSWRLQLLSLLKEILTYRGKNRSRKMQSPGNEPVPCMLAMDSVMNLPIPPEILKSKKGKSDGETNQESTNSPDVVYNPWPALCSFVWAYPNNDIYHNLFFQMLQSAVVEHHEASLRLILQKSKFLSRAVNSVSSGPLQGVLMNCLNLLHLRSQSLPPGAFLHQYLGSHDGWKQNVDQLVELTINQQTPIQADVMTTVDLNLGSTFATKLGLSDIDEWDASTATTASESSGEDSLTRQSETSSEAGGGKKKKKKKKK